MLESKIQGNAVDRVEGLGEVTHDGSRGMQLVVAAVLLEGVEPSEGVLDCSLGSETVLVFMQEIAKDGVRAAPEDGRAELGRGVKQCEWTVVGRVGWITGFVEETQKC